jgi:hypothetical protein
MDVLMCGMLNALLVLLLQVNRAVDYVGGGTKALVEAKQYQKSKRKWCCCAIITLLVILIIVIVVVSGCCWRVSSWHAPCATEQPCLMYASLVAFAPDPCLLVVQIDAVFFRSSP